MPSPDDSAAVPAARVEPIRNFGVLQRDDEAHSPIRIRRALPLIARGAVKYEIDAAVKRVDQLHAPIEHGGRQLALHNERFVVRDLEQGVKVRLQRDAAISLPALR